MAQRILAHVNPEVLRWARESAGYDIDIVARKTGVTVERLQAFEAGALCPTLNQLRNIAKVYKRPTAVFYRSTTPTEPKSIHDFRMLPDTERVKIPELVFELRRAYERRAIALEIVRQLGEKPRTKLINATIDEDPAMLAKRVRDMLTVSVEEQYSWKDEYAALRNWIRAVESLGILVFQVSGIDVDRFRGFSTRERPLPSIGLNAQDSPRGRIFTLMHELVHLVLYQEGINVLYEESSHEVFCNMVAGAVLVPEEEFLKEEVVRYNTGKLWDDTQLRVLANKYSVSTEVVLRRLLLLGRTTSRVYREKRIQFQEVLDGSQKSGGGFLQYYKKVFRNNGPAYTNLVLTAYHRQSISIPSMLDYLGGIKLSHIDNIELELDRYTERGEMSHVLV